MGRISFWKGSYRYFNGLFREAVEVAFLRVLKERLDVVLSAKILLTGWHSVKNLRDFFPI